MLKAIADIFAGFSTGSEAADETDDHGLRLATAVLLVETARADYSYDEIEKDAIDRLLSEHLSLSGEEIATLIEHAAREADRVASLQGFTRKLHEELDYADKSQIVKMLWRVALADNELSKYEDALVRKIGDLLYVSRSDQNRLRSAVLDDG